MQRRSNRARAQPLSLAEEQAERHIHAQELANLRRAMIQSLQPDIEDDTDEEPIDSDDEPAVDDDEEEKENIPPAPAWTDNCTNIITPSFTHPTGPQLLNHHLTTELQYFQQILIDHTISLIAHNTTLYAHSKGMSSTWKITKEEMWLFIAVHICMGIVSLPRLHMYWEKDWRQPFVVRNFSQHRFTELLRAFHISPPSPPASNHTVIDKVGPLITACQHSFSSSYLPEQALVVDEAMIGYKGRDKMKQYIKTKPTRWGYKVWCIAGNGYLLNFDVYRGRQQQSTHNRSIHQTVIDLVHPYRNRNHILHVDNLFSSPDLFDHLERLGVRSCGTLRPNRQGLPVGLVNAGKALEKSQTRVWQRGNLGCLALNDRRLVYFLTNHIGVLTAVSFDEPRSDGSTVTITKPKVVHEYNIHRGEADRVDQLHSNYAMGRKSMKNWPSLAWWLIDMCIVNAYRIFILQTHSTISQLDFRINLMHQLEAAYPPQAVHEQQAPAAARGRPAGAHYPILAGSYGDCVHCSDRSRARKRSRHKCDHCHVYLCIVPCFKQYHVHRHQHV